MPGLTIRADHRRDPHAIPFYEWLDARIRATLPRDLPEAQRERVARVKRERLTIFIQQFCHLRDDLLEQGHRDPTATDYATTWGGSEPTYFRILDEFRAIFGTEYPSELCEVLWDATPKWDGSGTPPRLMPFLAGRVVEL